jgi:cystathionine beta-lyase/cystathionine gamma-synthase
MVCFWVGAEHPDDVIADLDQALGQADSKTSATRPG